MFISALSITTTSLPPEMAQPVFGAAQRLEQPGGGLTALMPQAQGPMQQMQTMIGQMFQLLTMLMGGGQASPLFDAGSSPTPVSDSSGTGGASQSSAPTTDLKNVQGSDFGKQFAAKAEQTANKINTSGLCLKGVNDTMQAMGLPVHREAAAYMAVDDFQKNPKFREVKVSKDQLKSLPAGAVVIWNKGSGLPYGHISVALGDGREASSKVRNQLLLNTDFHVFLPK